MHETTGVTTPTTSSAVNHGSTDTDEAWMVLAHWVNSSPTLHGGFTYAADADGWASTHLAKDQGCLSWDLMILTPVVVEQVA